MGTRPAGTHEPADHGRRLVPRMLLARQAYAYGPQSEYVDDDPSRVGFTRHGDPVVSGGAGLAVLMTSRRDRGARMRMFVGAHHAGETWSDLLGEAHGAVRIDAGGWGCFTAPPSGVAVWADVAAPGRVDIERFVL